MVLQVPQTPPLVLLLLLLLLHCAGLTVCEVMVCAEQHQFTEDGTPLTRAAALRLTKQAATPPKSFAGLSAALSLVTPASFESCDGYTTQSYQGCPTGKKVISVT
jgi:hypothetical protein